MTFRSGFEVVATDPDQVDTGASEFLFGATGLSGLQSGAGQITLQQVAALIWGT
ncbi:MAG TPA: hypothetical protein VGL95_06220 [Acetobacteraceae bacterium]|jgi:hypothetical protein